MENHKKVQQPFLDENNAPIQMGVNDNLEKLKALFPSVVKDGFVDFTALKEELGEIEEVGAEKYNFTWWGKQGAKIEAKTPPVGKTLNYKENGNDNFKGETENLYIEGDNLEVLKLLKENYYGKIKMIYIDPPYNTGNDFVYKDNFHMSQEESDIADGLSTAEGDRLEKRYKENSKGNRYHSNWLNMIYSRLKVAQNLLKDDGVVFVSIDDNEIHNLRKVCDEIFGEANFVGQITVVGNPRGRDYGGIARMHDYIICYQKTDEARLSRIIDEERKFDTFDDIGGFELRELRNRNIKFNDKNRPNLYYPFYVDTNKIDEHGLYDISLEYHEDSVEVFPAVSQGINTVWRWGKPKALENMNINIKAKKMSDGRFMIVEKYRELKVMARSVWWDKVSNTESGTLTVKELFSAKTFDYPKPHKMIKRLIEMATTENDLILDFFGGSSTTAHGIMQMNAEDGGERKFILVQLPEQCDENSEALKHGYKNICEIGKERIRRAGNKIVEELEIESKKYLSENTQTTINSVLLNENAEIDSEGAGKDKYLKNPELLDIGFKVFEVGKTNIKWNDINSIEDVRTIEELQLQGKDRFDFMPHFTDENVVYEIALQHRGVPLSSSLEKLTNIGERTYLYANSYLVCLEEDVTEDIIKKISQISPQPISYYFRDSAFGENIALKDDTIRTFKDLISINYGNNKGSYTLEFI